MAICGDRRIFAAVRDATERASKLKQRSPLPSATIPKRFRRAVERTGKNTRGQVKLLVLKFY